MLICFDIDGTLADLEHRRGWLKTKPKNWDAFKAGIPHDGLIEPMAKMFRVLAQVNTVILASGRGEETRDMTHRWLLDNGLWPFEKLYMRPENDYRCDSIVKKEILDQIIADYGQKPDIVFDDRPRVVKMWRENGVFVADVYQGKEDF